MKLDLKKTPENDVMSRVILAWKKWPSVVAIGDRGGGAFIAFACPEIRDAVGDPRADPMAALALLNQLIGLNSWYIDDGAGWDINDDDDDAGAEWAIVDRDTDETILGIPVEGRIGFCVAVSCLAVEFMLTDEQKVSGEGKI